MTETAFVATEKGETYNVNEDRFFVNDDLKIWAVFDGEFENGYVSKFLRRQFEIDFLERTMSQHRSISEYRETVFEIVKRITEIMLSKKMGDEGYCSGSTMSVAFVVGNELGILHIGDSRIYVQKNGEWTLVTQDHTFLKEKELAGIVYDDETEKLFDMGIVTRVVGFPEPKLDFHLLDATEISKVLLCTDGVWKSIDPEGDAVELPCLGSNSDIGEKLGHHLSKDLDHENATIIVASIFSG